MACSALVGAGLILFFSTSQSVFQLSATDGNRGRVMAIYSIILTGAQPIGNLLTGFAADRWGEAVVLRLQGLAILLIGLAIFCLHLRRAPTATPEETEEQPDVIPLPTRRRTPFKKAA
jgi:MFS family permease